MSGRLRALWRRLGATLGRDRHDQSFDEELASHLSLHIDDNIRAGMSVDEARRVALARVGSRTGLREWQREQRRLPGVDATARDLRHGVRLLARSPLFTGVAVLLLGLGIGANTTVFTIANALLLRSLPVDQPERLALLAGDTWTYPIFEELQRHDLGGATIGAWASNRMPVRVDGLLEADDVQMVSGRFFEVLGADPLLGRTLGAEDDRRGGGVDGPVAVISHAYWQRRFGGDPAVLSRAVSIEDISLAIVGVMPPGYFGPEVGRGFDVAIPIGVEPLLRGTASMLDMRSMWWLNVIVRRGPGQSLEAAQQRLRDAQPTVRMATLPEHYRVEDRDRYLAGPFTLEEATRGLSYLRSRYERPLAILGLAAGLVLLVTCANLANLLLARASARRAEMSLRLALGASRTRLIAQLLVEGLILSTLGAVAGLALSWVSSRLIVGLLSTADVPVHLDLPLDWRVIGFTGAAVLVTTLFCSLAPALRATRVAPGEAFKEQSRSVAGESRLLTTHALMVLQVALSLALVVVAGLLVQTFTRLASETLGFEPGKVVVADVSMRRDAVSGDARGEFYRRLRETAAALPGIEQASLSSFAPMSGAGWNNSLAEIDGRSLSGTERERVIWHNAVSEEFFATYGTTLIAGRTFGGGDVIGAPPVAIVNDAFVQRYMPGEDPIGRLIKDGHPEHAPWLVVGRVGDARYSRDLRREAPPTVYLAHRQQADAGGRAVISVRMPGGGTAALERELARAIEGAGQPVTVRVRRVNEFVDSALTQERLVATVAGFFGGLALLIAGVGLYGVTAYGVNRRRAELGIRLTLGARPSQIVQLVFSRVALVVGLGVTAGILVALWMGSVVRQLLYELEPSDPRTLLLSAVTLGLTGALAAMVPAWRAARTDPAAVLREQ